MRNLASLLATRSQLAREVLEYVDDLAADAARLPAYYPARLRAAGDGKTPFDAIRQMVRAVDRRSLERYLAEEHERLLASGRSAERKDYRPHRAYAHRAGRPEDDSRPFFDRDEEPHPPPPVPWDKNAGEKFHRAVVLGDPGCGKTWLCRFEARRLALAAKKGLEDHAIGLDEVVLPILMRLSNLKAGRGALETSLVNLVARNRSERFRQYVTDRIASGRAVIILDAWDEVQPAQTLRHRIEAFARDFPGPRFLLTSRIVGYDSALPPIPQAQELELLAFEPPEIDAFVGAWFADNADAAREFQAMLAREHQVRGLARIPLMLTLMCRVFVDCREKKRPFPTRRAELYDLCLRGLVRDWWAYDDKPAIRRAARRRTNTYVNAVIGLLQDCALGLFAEGAEQFPEADLAQKMETPLGARKWPRALRRRDAGSLIEELKQDGVFTAANDDEHPPLLFLHRTFQEYLAAGALAARLNDPKQGWDSCLTLAGHDWKIVDLVDRKAWDPAWAEVIVLMAGQLQAPHAARFLGMLADPKPTATNPCGDDYFRHRLGLAALCLAELQATILNHCAATVDEITTAAFSLWQEYHRSDTAASVSHLARALPSLAQANGRLARTSLLDRLCRTLRTRGVARKKRVEAAAALGQMGQAAARHPDVPPALVAALHDADSGVRWNATEALARMSEAAVRHPDVLPALVEAALHDTDPDVRLCAARALGRMGEAAARHPDVLPALVAALDDRDSFVRRRAARVLGGMGEAAARHPDVLPALVAVLHDTDSGVRESAAEALGNMSEAAARHPEVLPVLVQAALHDKESDVREIVAKALGAMGEAAARHPDLLPALAAALQDTDSDVHWSAAHVLGGMGEAAARHPDVLPALVEAALHDTDSGVRRNAAWALGRMGEAAARHPDLLPALVAALHDTDSDVQESAATALVWMGEAAARHPDVLPALLAAMHCTYLYVHESAAEALGAMGEAAARHPDVLPALVAALHDTNAHCYVREGAMDALGQMGEAAARHPDVLPALVGAARHDTDSDVRGRAATALGRMGEAAARHPDVLAALAAALHDTNSDVRERAATALGRMGEAAARHPDVLPALVAALHDTDSGVRWNAAEALGRMGEAAARHPDVLPALAAALHDTDVELRWGAAEALGRMGEAAARHPDVLPALAAALHDTDSELRWDAAEALGRIGETAARHPEVLPALLAALRDTDSDVRLPTADALERIMAQGVRIFQDAPSRWKVLTVAELSRPTAQA